MADESILIAGGGIAGLAAALALARASHAATVLEQAALFEEAGAGLQLGPNAVKALKYLGAWEAVEPSTFAPPQIMIRDGGSGAHLSRIGLGRAFERRFGEPYRVSHRADLLAGLLAAAQASTEIALMPGKRLTGFAETGRGVVAEIDTGESFSGNALIGADGVRSMVRQKLLGDGPPLFAGQVLFRALVPISAVSVDLDLAAVSLWLCPGAHVVHYPVTAGRQLNIVAAAHGSWTDDGWSAAADSAEVIQHFQAAHHVLAAILAAPKSWMKWAGHRRRPARRWSKGHATLIGDAAHPMLPFLAQGAAMALEDAAVLSAVLSQDEDVPRAFATYENHRIARTGRVVRTSLRQASIYHASGPFRLARNAVFRLLGNDIFLARLAWLYGWEPPEC